MGGRVVLRRREFCAIAGSAVASVAFGNACRLIDGPGTGRLTFPRRENVKTTTTGQIRLGLDHERDAILQIPKNAGQSALPLLVMLHGATQSAEEMIEYLGSPPEEAVLAVLAPNSRDTTWDAIGARGFGADVDFLHRALQRAFETAAIDSARVSIGGFSDGASYALSLGLINGDLFESIVAFSPGYIVEGSSHGKPRVFISHGTHDHILPFDRCGWRLASMLKTHGYEVMFREFDGDHELPPEVAREAVRWVVS
jgi:phospholipase/carboxylesterase